jgi:hypothetical protein
MRLVLFREEFNNSGKDPDKKDTRSWKEVWKTVDKEVWKPVKKVLRKVPVVGKAILVAEAAIYVYEWLTEE